MTKIVSHHRASATSLNHSWREYWRDERDRITAFQKSTNNVINPMENGRGDHYQYDPEGQLTDAWYNAVDPAGTTSAWLREDHFNYDPLGNRRGTNYVQTHGVQDFSRKNNGLNQYSMWSPFSLTNYDDDIGGTWGEPHRANGVLMQDGNITAGYNALNQAIMINTYAMGSNWMFFGYDPVGRCVKRWTGPLDSSAPFPGIPPVGSNPATYYYYDGWSLIEEGTGAGTTSRNYIHGARVDEIVKQLIQYNPSPRYFHYDARGHCTFQTYANGNIAEQYEYDAFGYPYFFNASGNNIGYSPWGNRFLFTGREWLSDVKLYDYRNRMYQPELGRFLQPDPKHFGAGDYNLYRYCHNDPVNKSDPLGLDVIVMESPQTLFGNGLQGHVATISGNDGDGWHLFEKQGGPGTSGNVHQQFGTLEEFRSSGRGDGYTSAARIKTDAVQDKAMQEYGESNYNKPYDVEKENCASLSRGIAQNAGMSSETKYVNVLGSHIPVPKAVMSEAAKLGKPAINQIHSDGQLKKDEEARLKGMAPGYRQ